MAAAEEVWQPRFFCLYCAITGGGRIESMPVFSNLMFRAVRWAACRGLREEQSFSNDAKKLQARRTGVRGETYAYWYLRKQGYIFVARNYTPRGIN